MIAGFTAVPASSAHAVARPRLVELFGGLDAGFADALPGEAAVIELPIGNGEFATLLYLRRSPIVEQVIRHQGWRVLPIGN